MKRLKFAKEIEDNCTDNFIIKNRGKGNSSLTFLDFRKYVVEKYKDKINKIPNLMEELTDFDDESGDAIASLYNDVYTNFIYEIDSNDLSEDIESNLTENYMYDYFLNLKN